MTDKHDDSYLVAMSQVLVNHVFASAARRAGQFSSKTLAQFGHSLVGAAGSPLQKAQLAKLPSRPEAYERQLDFQPPLSTFVVCPECHCNYPLSSKLSSEPPITRCTDKPYPFSDECGTDLYQDGTPIKTFHYVPFEEWFGRFISRPEVEEMLDDFCARVDEEAPDRMSGIEDSPFIRTFLGPGSTPDDPKYFFRDRGEEGRAVFSLSVDWYNVEGNLKAGAHRSTGVISLQPLSLFRDGKRHDIDEFYVVGLIQGPSEPSAKTASCRHYLRPLVSAIRTSFERGNHVAQTTKHPRGRTFRSAIVIEVSDVKAARNVGGHADINHSHVCVQCNLYNQNSIMNANYDKFEPASGDEYRKRAQEWCMQDSYTAQDHHFKQHGVRDSELWNLPGWNPVTSLVVDPMHTLAAIQKEYTMFALRLTDSDITTEKKKKIQTHKLAFIYPFQQPRLDTALCGGKESSNTGMGQSEILDWTDLANAQSTVAVITPRDAIARLSEHQRQHRNLGLNRLAEGMRAKDINELNNAQLQLMRGCDDSVRENHLERLLKSLERLNKGVLQYLCLDLSCTPASKDPIKAVYAQALVDWVCCFLCPFYFPCYTDHIADYSSA
jgi:hypothetical protein